MSNTKLATGHMKDYSDLIGQGNRVGGRNDRRTNGSFRLSWVFNLYRWLNPLA